jgi:hypothetical protein
MRSLFAMIVVTAWGAVHVVRAHGALYWPTPRNSIDNVLPEYKGGKSPTQGCTCSNGNGDLNTGCDLGLRGTSEGLSDGQSCLWWSQGWICPLLSSQYGDAAAFCCGTPGCSIGCEKCATELDGFTAFHGTGPQSGKIGFRTRYCNATWNSKGPFGSGSYYTHQESSHIDVILGAPVPMINATLPKEAWTMNMEAEEGSVEDSYRYNPWRAPGEPLQCDWGWG